MTVTTTLIRYAIGRTLVFVGFSAMVAGLILGVDLSVATGSVMYALASAAVSFLFAMLILFGDKLAEPHGVRIWPASVMTEMAPNCGQKRDAPLA